MADTSDITADIIAINESPCQRRKKTYRVGGYLSMILNTTNTAALIGRIMVG